ncbi:hypothetical protein, partial [Rurimicrobium arvi]|uniref:hypothetical protein n=1 Tax=Rurimicrobium arvi TaxID=2049916 RepID=UPI0031E0EEBF
MNRFLPLPLRLIAVLIILLCFGSANAQNKIGDNRSTILPGSLLELESTNRGFLTVRMTTAQMKSIPVSPAAKGMSVYNLDSNCLCVYNGTIWRSICTDTAYLNAQLSQKLDWTDTTAMLSAYLRSALGVKYTDTFLMLKPYTKISTLKDSLLSIRAAIDSRVIYDDTAAMLIGYVRKTKYTTDSTVVATGIAARVKYTDTASMLNPYATKAKVLLDSVALAAQINARVKYTDTASMLSPYVTKAKELADSAALGTQINARVKYTDTASMLSPYVTKAKELADSAALGTQIN